jgi:hypothetical protein
MSGDYSLTIKRYKRPRTLYRRAKLLWAWEILRRSKPIGVRLYGDGFTSEQAAKLAGERRPWWNFWSGFAKKRIRISVPQTEAR